MIPRAPMLAFQLSPGEAGVAECLAAMAQVVRACPVLRTVGTGARVMETAAHLRRLSATPRAYMDRVYTFLVDHTEFTRDPPFTELVRHPDELLETAARDGRARCDCDEVATLGASLLWAAGIRPVFLVAGRPGDLDTTGRVKLSHVFYGAGSLPFDPQERIPARTWPPARAIGRLERYEIIRETLAPH